MELSLGGSFGLSGGSFTLGVFGSFGSGFGSSLGFSGSLTLGGDGSSLGLVGLLLSLEASLLGVAGVVLNVALLAVDLSLFGLEPLVELHIGLFLADSAFLDTNLEVTTEQNAFIGEDATHGVARLSTILHPFDSAVEIELDGGGIGQRIVGAQLLDKFSIARCTTIRNNDMIEGLVLLTMTL